MGIPKTKHVGFNLFLSSIFLWMGMTGNLLATDSVVANNHPVYSYLQRLETLGFIRDLRLYSKPNTRAEIAELLLQAYQASDSGRELTSFDLGRMKRYMQEFNVQNPFATPETQDGENHLVRYPYKDWAFTGDLLAEFSHQLTAHQAPYPVLGIGGEMRGAYNPSKNRESTLTGYLRWLTFAEFVDDSTYGEFSANEGRAYTVRDGVLNSNQIRTGVFWSSPVGRVAYLHDTPKWGRGYLADIQIGGSTPEFDFMHYMGYFNKLRFTFLMGNLNSDYGQRFLGGHRLEWQPFNWLQLSVSETVIYGDSTNARGLEYTYFNPFIPYTAAEMNVGNKDNNTGAIGFTAFFRQEFTAYGELMFDDFVFNKSFTRYFTNKWAALAGLYWLDPFGFDGSGMTIEYVRIEPWVYTHVNPVNIYRHFGSSVGYPLKPNSDRILTVITKGIGVRCQITSELMYTRHGAGEFEQSYKSPESEPYVPHKHFLQGKNSYETHGSIGIRYEFMQSSYVRCSVNYSNRSDGGELRQIIFGISFNY